MRFRGLVVIGSVLLAACGGDSEATNEGDGSSGSAGSGASGEGASGEGASGEGASGEGASGEGASGEGASGEGASGTNAGMDGQSGAGSAGTGPIEGPDVEVGQFGVQLIAPRAATPLSEAREGSSAILGTVGDKPVAEPISWELEREDSGCSLLIPKVPFCDPTCGAGEVCVGDDTCEIDRKLVDVGTVTVTGVTTTDGMSEVELTAVRNTYQSGTLRFPYPAFEEGDEITLSATGAGEVPGFEITTTGIATLEVLGAEAPDLIDGEPFTITWEPASSESSRISVKLDISHHGGTKGKLECEVDDNGELTIPADMVSELIALGVAGFPSVIVTRTAAEETQLPMGRVRLRIYEYVERFVTIPGLVSCGSPADCEDGQTCLDDKTCG